MCVCVCVCDLWQITVELASDSKDFAAALAKTQLAEMGDIKIVPIPQLPKSKTPPVVTTELVNNAAAAATS